MRQGHHATSRGLAYDPALSGIRPHEQRLVGLARNEGLDGIICGHFHLPALHDRHRLIYANCGDWLDNFAAVAEDHQGRLCLLGADRGATHPARGTMLPPHPDQVLGI